MPPIGPVVGVAGFVKRPAIYELKETMRVSEVLTLAGGVTPFAYLQRVQMERIRIDKEKYVVDLDLSRLFYAGDRSVDIPVKDGDLIKVFPIDTRIYNTVQLEGFVRHPGEYELKPGMRLADLLTPQEVLPAAHLDRVEVVRINPQLETEVHFVDAKQLWRGDPSQNLTLHELDRVVVKSELRPEESVTLGGEVRRPGTYTIRKGERLSSVLTRAGGYTADAYLKGVVFTRQRVKEEEQKRLDEFIRAQEAALLTQSAAFVEGAGSLSAGGAKDEAALQSQTVAQRRELLRVLASQVVLGRMVVHLDEPDKMAGTADDVLLENGDALTIPKKPSSVLVVGAVRNPTAILHKE
ncbi:MAG: SLBB domain-containing protein, partial [Candidatus Methylomirabilales bacterium]